MGNVVPISQDGINPKIIKWFQLRGISEKTLTNTKVYSGKHLQNGASFRIVPSPEGDIIVFPFVSNGKVLNEKYRAAQKRFYQSGGEKVFWNVDVISDPALQAGGYALVITEGEIDALSFIEAGYPYVISVPNGAPPPKEGRIELPDDEAEDTAFSYIRRSWDALKGVKRIILATDNDEPGRRLQKELAMRLGEARCRIVEYLPECKDANEVLVKYGQEAVLELVAGSQPYPIAGLYKVTDLPSEPAPEALTTGWGRLDEYLMVYTPAFMVVTGKPNEGKSTWTTQLAAQLAINHNWNISIASFEMMVQPFITDALMSVYREQVPDGDPDQWLIDHFSFIIARSDEDDNYDLDWLLDRAAAAFVRYGIKVLIIDPWNELDHSFGKNETHTDYIGRAIRSIKRFARDHGILVIVVAHPTKGASEKKKACDIDLFDIADSAHFHNKADLGAVIARIENSYQTNVYIKKIRYQPKFGKRGVVPLTFDPYRGTFGQ
jgi:twinkle protein